MKNLYSSGEKNQYFCTDHLKKDLKNRSIRGGAVTMIAQVFKFSLNLISNVVLARLLTPQDYGIVGMVTAITGFVTLFKDLGLSTATVQKEEINHQQVSTLFWVNIALSVATAFITVAIAPVLAWFYDQPRLLGITLALASGFIISGFGVQHTALLNRQMQYKALMFNDLLSMALGIVAAIAAALFGLGYWALVIMLLVCAVVNTVGVWMSCDWRPSLPVGRSGIGSMLAFGGHLTGFGTINYFARNLDNILIGRYWGAEQLGLYAKAYQLLLLPLTQISTPIARVAIPTLSRVQQEPQQFRYYYLKAIAIVAFLTMPTVTFLVIVSEEMIELLLGSQWNGTAELFRVLSISALVQPICHTTAWLYVSTGRADRMFKWGLFSSSLVVTSFFVGLPHQASGVALAYAIAMLLQTVPCIYFAIQGTAITMLDVLQTIQPTFVSSVVASAIVFAIKIIINASLPIWITVIIYSVVMTIVYLLLMFYVFGKKSFYLGLLRNFQK
ncbi:lipopolysaccharide biosynthesis protein [Calothrix sp. PCC 7507]|uniref:lipopolysaccharide biosynthesis protein n=1 Tax=Calothrix sp. PCC 7507 TaxID=99598 RepID=UPI00029EFCF5|nr:lipopolysaccharide biosynthesis protein [Calothrix sp. PCC 7507]AFY34480.1 polysaccharide biosynthesis protein [Calothrix sp. PCC 7507]